MRYKLLLLHCFYQGDISLPHIPPYIYSPVGNRVVALNRELRATLLDLQNVRSRGVARCSGDPAPSCPVLDILTMQERA